MSVSLNSLQSLFVSVAAALVLSSLFVSAAVSPLPII
jgi:hypothetical protein